MKRILIADDERHVLRLLTQSLERAGYCVESVLNGEEALKKIRTRAPQVLITDIDMPRMSGEILCKRIDAEMPKRDFRIYVMTSRTEMEHRDWSRRIDDLGFLEKPISIRRLTTELAAYFEQHAESTEQVA